jgi:HD-GYP domain-containing protein (c-di-GMP phosphodiesterase class II)
MCRVLCGFASRPTNNSTSFNLDNVAMTDAPPFAARLYVALCAFLALALTYLGVAYARVPTLEDTVLGVVFAALIVLAVRYPVHYAYKTKLALDSSVAFAATLLFEPGIAMFVVGVGSFAGDILMRRPVDETIFNSAQLTLQVGIAASVLLVGGWDSHAPHFNMLALPVLVVVSALAMYLVNSWAVAGMVALHVRQSVVQVWRQMGRFDVVEQTVQIALGLLGAAVASSFPWMLPILLLPVLPTYRSSIRHVQLRTQTIQAVEALADIIDIRDPYTADHSRRVASYAREIATELALPTDEIELITRAARVHDVGKIVVELAVLTKQGKLTDDEWEQLKAHPGKGTELLQHFPEFARATQYVRHHHERMDGKGYPDGIGGEDIPLGARVIAVADSFDAMASARPYRAGLPLPVVIGELKKHRGTQWDAHVVDAMLALIEREVITVPGTTLPAETQQRVSAERTLRSVPS